MTFPHLSGQFFNLLPFRANPLSSYILLTYLRHTARLLNTLPFRAYPPHLEILSPHNTLIWTRFSALNPEYQNSHIYKNYVIWRDGKLNFKRPSMWRGNAQYTGVALKPQSDQKCLRYRRFSDPISDYFCDFFSCFLLTRNSHCANENKQFKEIFFWCIIHT